MGGDAEKQEGMRYFYDNMVYKKFDKIAKKYGVEIEEINLRETMFKELTKQYTYAENNANAVLTKMTATELLNNLTKQDVELPDYFKMFIAVPRFDDPKVLRTEMINQKSITELLQTQANIIKSYEDPQPMSETQELLRDSVEKKVGSYGTESEYLVWVYNKGTENEEVYLNLPAIQVKLSNYAKTGAEGFADEGLRDLSAKGVVTNFETSKYINDYDAVLINEEIDDTVRTETYYKLPLPKELQKEILSKPKKMSKLQGQSNRLFA
jgi:NACalpha-BTF3-like transcription factor